MDHILIVPSRIALLTRYGILFLLTSVVVACGDGVQVNTASAKTVAESETTDTGQNVDQPVSSTRHIVKAGTARFEPLLVFAQSGDEICWTNMNTHDSESIPGLIPEAAEPWHTPVNTDACVTLMEPGVYIYKCNPHYALGMGGAILVGKADNMNEVEARATGKARRLVNKLKQALEAEELDDNKNL